MRDPQIAKMLENLRIQLKAAESQVIVLSAGIKALEESNPEND